MLPIFDFGTEAQRQKFLLTGTPVENSTMDLWSQMSFINPGLLGTQAFFRKEFLKPIEKNQDENRTKRLHALIKPFILRRHKSQVAKELPAKTEQLSYCPMTEEQAHAYEETKSFYRNKILRNLDEHGPASTQFLLLQGLTRLRQIANHPRLADETYTHDSGKLREVLPVRCDSFLARTRQAVRPRRRHDASFQGRFHRLYCPALRLG